MKFQAMILAAAIGLTLPVAHADNIKLVDKIAAVADNSVITERDLLQAMSVARHHLPKGTKISDNELRQQVLQQMINQSLIVQAGKRRDLNATDAEIDAVIQQSAASQKTSVERVYAQAAQSGISRASLRRNIADNIISQKV